jgi:septal ring-binding cell division protein DamX
VSQYARGDYAAAKATASSQAARSSGIERDRANLIAGLSAAQLGENPEASRLLSPLTTHSDPEIAGRAIAGTGLVARNQGDKARGASLMSDGAKKVTGDMAAKGHMAAGDTYAEIGARDQAMAEYRAGAAVAQRPDLKSSLQERLEGKRYTVQVGAFASRANADRKAGEVRSKAESLGLGAPKVQTGTASGKTSYLVQIGNYPTRQDAKLAALKMGGGAVVAQVDM